MPKRDAFKLVEAKPKSKRISGLYNFLMQDSTWIEKAALHATSVNKKPASGYIIITLDTRMLPGSLKKCTPISWHIRIDETYHLKKRFLAQWHHTLEFADLTGTRRIMHAYYENGVFLYLTVDGEEVADPEIINDIQNQSNPALQLALKLIAILQDAQQVLTSQFEQEQRPIYDLKFSSTISEAVLLAKLETCTRLHTRLQAINEEASDAPLIFLQNRVAFLLESRKVQLVAPATALETTAAVPVTSSGVKPRKSAAKPRDAKLIVALDKSIIRGIRQKIGNIERALNSVDAEAILTAFQSIPHLEQEIADLYKKHRDHSDSVNILDNLLLQVTAVPRLVDLFKKLVQKQAFTAAMGLFEHDSVRGNVSALFFGHFLCSICNVMIDTKAQTAYAEFCDYLYEHSEQYRSALSVFFNAVTSYKIHDVATGESFIFRLVFSGKHILFKTFLHQLNSTTLIAQRCGRRASDIFSSITSMKEARGDLIAYMLSKGYPSEHPPRQFDSVLSASLSTRDKAFGVGSYAVWDLKEGSFERMHHEEKLLQDYRDIVPVPSAFYHACLNYHTIHTEDMLELAKRSSPLYFVLGFSYLMHSANRIMRIPTSERMILIFADNDERIRCAEIIGQHAYAQGATNMAFMLLVENHAKFALFTQLGPMLSEKIDSLSPEEILNIHKELIRMLVFELQIPNLSERSHNFVLTLHLATILSATLLPESKSNFGVLLSRIRACIEYLRKFAEESRQSVLQHKLICQTLCGQEVIEIWIAGYQRLLTDLERLSFWARSSTDAPTAAVTTMPLYAAAAAKTPALKDAATAKTVTPEPAPAATETKCVVI